MFTQEVHSHDFGVFFGDYILVSLQPLLNAEVNPKNGFKKYEIFSQQKISIKLNDYIKENKVLLTKQSDMIKRVYMLVKIKRKFKI